LAIQSQAQFNTEEERLLTFWWNLKKGHFSLAITHPRKAKFKYQALKTKSRAKRAINQEAQRPKETWSGTRGRKKQGLNTGNF